MKSIYNHFNQFYNLANIDDCIEKFQSLKKVRRTIKVCLVL